MPTRDEIKPKVVGVIKAVTQTSASIEESLELFVDLGMTAIVRTAMALPYTAIARSHPGGIRILQKEARDLKTVKESIDLVAKRANGGA